MDFCGFIRSVGIVFFTGSCMFDYRDVGNFDGMFNFISHLVLEEAWP